MEGNKSTNSLADPALLEAIDKLFELGIGEYVALPQLLVIGDQSSGKSSVLEGLTGLSYPRDSTLCTRFATQITFRRAPIQKIAISVIPAIESEPSYAEKLRKWKRDDLKEFDSQAFVKILKEVYELMGLTEDSNAITGTKKSFANDVLKIEICGPQQEHLSVIDVPGIFRKTTQGVTTKADMAMVRSMVLSYMQNPRSAMLAVIPANVDIGTQEILDMAEQCDPQGQRTLGVLTKPDLVDDGAEQAIMDIVEGKSHALNLGWCVVRNSGQQQINDSSAERHAREKLFFTSEAPWNKLAKDRVGISALHTLLVDILGELIRREFPNVKADINKKLKTCRQSLDGLGPTRENKDQQQKYLLELATRFQAVTSLALRAHYGGDDLFVRSPVLKLATAVVRRNILFSDHVWKYGHTMAFSDEAGFKDDIESDKEADGDDQRSVVNDDEDNSILVRRYINDRELDDLMHDEKKIEVPRQEGIKKWLASVYKSSLGFELGTFDPALLPIIWKRQSRKWDILALAYVDDIISLVHAFTVKLLSKICKDDRIRRGLNSVLLEKLTERYKAATDHTNFLLAVERSGTPLTTNHYFADNLEKYRQDRFNAEIKTLQFDAGKGYGNVVQVDSIMSRATTNSGNVEHIVCDLHDILRSYYKVARKRFVDNVCMQAADFYLVTGPDSPVRVFSPAFVLDLTREQLETIAGEDAHTKRKRADLEREIASLIKGKEML